VRWASGCSTLKADAGAGLFDTCAQPGDWSDTTKHAASIPHPKTRLIRVRAIAAPLSAQ